MVAVAALPLWRDASENVFVFLRGRNEAGDLSGSVLVLAITAETARGPQRRGRWEPGKWSLLSDLV
jgi:hypothetical protein